MLSGASHARSELYGLFAELLSFPTERLVESSREGELEAAFAGMVAGLPYVLDVERDITDETLTYLDLQSEFMRLFDLPGGGPACPLYVGVFAHSRRDAMEELLRFYRYFGLTIAADSHDLPDALPTVLEFMHYLAGREAHAEPGQAMESFRAAQRDILDRHILRWVAMASVRLPDREAPPFYLAVVSTLHAFCVAEQSLLGQPVATAV